ncbi:S-layer homology domain-containing protein [Cohnella faecalis]|uniref:S-layer homology domain-containing protein n=1 Tax=Cohnella faecalis TaxID=2315694 RepID=A0A398CHT3_9BACL|nr:S-layer homology domain-containing protein [Cohnella faecalis]
MTVAATASDSGTISYQWYSNTSDSNSGGTPISGADSATYAAPTDTAGTFYYYAVVKNTNNAATGTKTATVTSNAVAVAVTIAPTYSIAAIANQTATPLQQGYAAGTQQTKTITVTNTGTGNLGHMSAALSGAHSNAFELTQPSATVNSLSSSTFTIRAKNGLAPGTYTVTVTISADFMTNVTFTVTQVVSRTYVPESPQNPEVSASVDVLVNGKAENAGKATTTTVNNQQVTTIAIDPQKLDEKLAAEGQHAVVTIPVGIDSDVIVGELNGQMIKNMEGKEATLELKVDRATYTLPAQQINIDALSAQLGESIALQDIKVRIEIASPTAGTVKTVEDAANKGKFALVAPSVDFTVKAAYGNKSVEVTSFNLYVERTIAIPDGVDPNKITTGIVVDPDGTVRHVPTKIVIIDGKYYAKISSLTNSTYSIVWHPLEFKDVANHWSKAAVNDMGSRMVISGVGNDLFNPDQDITRAEFAAIIVRGLGLKLEKGNSPFADVKAADWYSSAIQTAYSYGLINGFDDGTFRPLDKVTREQAMLIIAKAMKITALTDKLPSQDATALLNLFADGSSVSKWAVSGIADSVQAGIFKGRSGAQLAPKANITRAEVAVVVQQLLQKSDLI